MKLFFTLLTFLPLLMSCGNDSDLDELVMVEYGTPFTLKIGQTAISPDSAAVRLIDIPTDSRCANNTTCIWEGEIVAELEAAFGGQLYPLEIRNLISQSSLSRANFVRFRLELLEANPYPDQNGQISSEEYELTLMLTVQ